MKDCFTIFTIEKNGCDCISIYNRTRSNTGISSRHASALRQKNAGEDKT